jgi:hypothetical protein
MATGRGIERSFQCPAHNDTHASASVNTIKGVWVCYACGAHGVLSDVKVPEIDQIIAILQGSSVARTYPEAWLDTFDAHQPSPYWSRRYGEDVASMNRCGTDPVGGQPTYPMRNKEGAVWGVVTRSETALKYRYPTGVSAASTLFGQIKPAPVVVLVEGASDVMALQQGGVPQHWTVLGCYGAGLHMPQKQIVVDCGPRAVVAAFDDDVAGRNATLRTESQLHDVAPVLSHHWSTMNAKDPGDVPIAEARINSIRNTLTSSTYAKYA